MDGLNIISAQEARDIADRGGIVIRRLAKLVKEAADEGALKLEYYVGNSSSDNMMKLVHDTFEPLGYSVSVVSEDDGFLITITW